MIDSRLYRFLVKWRTKLLLIAPLLLIALSRPFAPGLGLGIALVLAGIALRFWAAGHLSKDETLAQTGPYALVRHPLYAGTIIVLLGWCLLSGSWLASVLCCAWIGSIYALTLRFEERWLRQRFEEYCVYERSVPRLLPRWSRLNQARRSTRFDWNRALSNRELPYAIWMLIASLLIVLKAWQ